MNAPVNFLLQIRFRPNWRSVDLLRTSTLNCLKSLFSDNDYCQSISIVAGELLENAIKYGDWTRPDPSLFRLHVQGDSRNMEIEVCNPVPPGSAAYDDVRSMIEWLGQHKTPADAYFARLKEVAERPRDRSGVSRIGLLRIAYEANCEIEATLDDEGVLHVKASSRR